FHRGPGHNTNTCYHFRDLVYDMNDRGEILWAEVRKHLQKGQNNQPQPRPQADLGIVQNPLPNHPPAQAPPVPPPAREPVPPPAAAPQAPQENVQRISTIVPVGPRRVMARSQTWSIDGESLIPASQPTEFAHDLTVPPVIYMVEPESEPQNGRPDFVIPSAVPPQFLARSNLAAHSPPSVVVPPSASAPFVQSQPSTILKSAPRIPVVASAPPVVAVPTVQPSSVASIPTVVIPTAPS